MLDWREWEHEDVDLTTINHQPSIDALKAYLMRLFAVAGRHTGPLLLYWWSPARNGTGRHLPLDWFA